MDRKLKAAAVSAVLVFAIAAATAQPAAGPSTPASEVQNSYNRIKGFIMKAAEETPAEDYQYKPTPDIRTFARVVEHVIEAQNHLCGVANGTMPANQGKTPAETADKAVIIESLKASFAECDRAYAATNPANMADLIEMGPTKRSRIGFLWGNVSHDNEQYATLALYMRLKGLVPPSSEK
jgi:hypothetical protein